MAAVDNGGQTLAATRFAELTGVTRDRLRTWERRYGFPAPVRVAGGPRRYRVEDVPRVVAVRRAAGEGTPLPVAIAQARDAVVAAGPPAAAFQAALELAPMPVALVSGPSPLRLEWGNAALRALHDAPQAGAALPAFEDAPEAAAAFREQLTRELPPAAEVQHPSWAPAAGHAVRSAVYRLPVAPGERPVVAVVGLGTHADREARAALPQRTTEVEALRPRGERHERWLDALAALTLDFEHDPGPDVVESALDALLHQTRAVDAGVASYVSGVLALPGTRRDILAATRLTVAAHPELGEAVREVEAVWLEPATAAVLGVPAGLHALGVPVAVAGEVVGVLLMVFEDHAPGEDDDRRLLAALSAAVGFAALRNRLVREPRATVSGPEGARPPPGAGGPPPAG